LIEKIDNFIKKGFKIKNLGVINEKQVEKLLNENYRVIHPSIIESFGLVLVEAASKGNAIISPDLNYVYDVCKPSITYSMENINGMKDAIAKSINEDIHPSKLIIKDKTEELVNHLLNKLNEQN
jgi:glycosyltransferase involved in cell wall biosynthesis